MAKVMLVEDDLLSIQIVTEILRAEGHEVVPFNEGAGAIEAMERLAPEIVITDLNLGKTGPSGMDVLKRARALTPPAIVIVITGYGSFEIAVEATKLGAFDYLQKPFKAVELRLKLWKALSHSEVVSENAYLRKELRKKYQFNQIIGSAPAMQQVFRMVERVAGTDSTVLLRGESGTGKELIAKALHFNSRRATGPFVPINCSALPEHLLESELFGHRKGSFTGAIADKKGLFQEADGGTIFLDEIGSMSGVLQSRLLRVLQEREVRAVGDNVPFYVNVRVIAATNEPLEQRIKEGGFREDLYYRLNVISIPMPALRERRDDIPLLVAHFLRSKAAERGLKPYSISRRALEAMHAHAWPGNVRELENAIERASALCEDGFIKVSDLPPNLHSLGSTDFSDVEIALAPSGDTTVLTPAPKPANDGAAAAPAPSPLNQPVSQLKDFMRDQESAYIQRAIAQAGGDKEQAARALGVSLATLYRKLAEGD
ncbi:MAG: sigma-54 dependent DNA-binding response regulator [Limisphaerales bacterium]|nr:MAG: sigma-54 dependent DNA-binding response regulator [Limisphaerales bacterium]KAG0507960.1 MAG: sigma-54 dependent DNA-binding response regulator [Limisphaerales bacterium]TXT48330.1 MAG: sigma-54 dependent DNA-binding response regulator [Limisphaerales bacterium]